VTVKLRAELNTTATQASNGAMKFYRSGLIDVPAASRDALV